MYFGYLPFLSPGLNTVGYESFSPASICAPSGSGPFRASIQGFLFRKNRQHDVSAGCFTASSRLSRGQHGSVGELRASAQRNSGHSGMGERGGWIQCNGFRHAVC
jgi:hypothetical protein